MLSAIKVKAQSIQVNFNNINKDEIIAKAKRATTVALPLLTFYKPLNFPLALVFGGLRTVTSLSNLAIDMQKKKFDKMPKDLIDSAVVTISFVSTFFFHPIGIATLAGYDLISEIRYLIKNPDTTNHERLIKKCLNIISNTLFLSLVIAGGVEMTLAFCAFQILTGLYLARDEYKKRNYIEAAGHLLLSLIQLHPLSKAVKQLKTTSLPLNSLAATTVSRRETRYIEENGVVRVERTTTVTRDHWHRHPRRIRPAGVIIVHRPGFVPTPRPIRPVFVHHYPPRIVGPRVTIVAGGRL